MVLLRRVQRSLDLVRHGARVMHPTVSRLGDHVAHLPGILGLWGFLAESRLAPSWDERSHYLSEGIRRRLQRRTVCDLGRAEICRVDIGHCPGTVRQTW